MAWPDPCLTGTVTRNPSPRKPPAHRLWGAHTLQGQAAGNPRTTEDWAPGE